MFLELLMALAITALIAGATAGMMAAISKGESTRRDNRAFLIRAHQAKERLTAYLAHSRAILKCDGTNMVLWYRDSRQSDSVHASEVRWLEFDQAGGTLSVQFVKFPDSWSELAKALDDDECTTTTDWTALRQAYATDGHVATLPLVDGLADMSVSLDGPQPLASRTATFHFEFTTHDPDTTFDEEISVSLMEPHQPGGA